jgi:VanZ family protein
VVGYGLFAPPGKGPPILPWDKAEHFIAFFGLMVLALPAFPKSRLWIVAGVLIAAGGAVEYIQKTPLIHRDADLWDWVADSVGILAVAGVVIAARIRREMTGR